MRNDGRRDRHTVRRRCADRLGGRNRDDDDVTTDGVTTIADSTISITAKQTIGGLQSAASASLPVTIDTAAPASSANASSISPNATFKVTWSGQDDVAGAGMANYDILVSDNGGPFATWLAGTTSTSAYYRGQADHAYAFYTVARDIAGNTEPAPVYSDAQVIVNDITPPTLLRLRYDGRGAGGMVGNQLQLVFREDVGASIAPEDFVLTNHSTGQSVPAAAMNVSFDIPTATLTITFPGVAGGLLDDGEYTLQFSAASITDGANLALDTGGNGPDITLAFYRPAATRTATATWTPMTWPFSTRPRQSQLPSPTATLPGMAWSTSPTWSSSPNTTTAHAMPADGDANGDGLPILPTWPLLPNITTRWSCRLQRRRGHQLRRSADIGLTSQSLPARAIPRAALGYFAGGRASKPVPLPIALSGRGCAFSTP